MIIEEKQKSDAQRCQSKLYQDQVLNKTTTLKENKGCELKTMNSIKRDICKKNTQKNVPNE